LVAVDEGGVDLAQARAGGQPQLFPRQRCIRPEQPLDCARDCIGAGGCFECNRGNVGGEELNEQLAPEQRQPRHGAARQQARQPVIGMGGIHERRLDAAELKSIVVEGRRGVLETGRKFARLLGEVITVEAVEPDVTVAVFCEKRFPRRPGGRQRVGRTTMACEDFPNCVCAARAWLSIMVEKPWKSFTR